MSSRLGTAAAAWLVALTSIGWLDPHQGVRDANKLYAEGKYDDAAAAYNAALIDKPDSPELHFNLGDAIYKQGKYDEAVSSFQKVETAGDPKRASRVAYNVGNATYRQGQAVEQSEPQKALELYATALVSYRRALGLDPDDEDVKFNHELVAKHIEDLEKKLEEQKQQQEQQKQDQQQQDQQQQDEQKQDQQAQDQQKQDEQQQDQQKQDEKQNDQAQDQPGSDQPSEEPKPEPQPEDAQQDQGDQGQPETKDQAQEGAGEPSDEKQKGEEQPGAPSGEAVAGDQQEGDLSKGEAAAILDSQRGEEVSPEDIIKKQLKGARVAEPAEDW